MKPTHILVPIEDWKTFKEDGYQVSDAKWIDRNALKIDLSEEGIKVKAELHADEIESVFGIQAAVHGSESYQQCAREILNTKS